MRVDIHSHLAPSGYVKELKKIKRPPRILTLKDGSMQLDCGGGLSYPLTAQMVSVKPRLREMKENGIDLQILSLPLPGTDFYERGLAGKLAQLANDELMEVARTSKGRLSAAATVPLRFPRLAISELRHCVRELDMRMVVVFSNVAGQPLDSAKFLPFYKELVSLKIPMLIHPGRPVMMMNLREYGLAGAVGYVFDSTLAILRLVYSGLLEKLPALRVIVPHTGSTIPYLVGRIDHQYKLLPEGKRRLRQLPSEILRNVYVDTAQSLYRPATECAFNFTPHNRILFGSDYPFMGLKRSVQIVQSLSLPRSEEAMIFWENARSLEII